MAAISPNPVVVQLRNATPTATVIWCHGLGDSPDGWAQSCAGFAKALGGFVKFVLPYAPEQAVSCNGGMTMPSWMDLTAIPIHPDTPDNGLHQDESIALIQRLVDAEVALGIPAQRIILAGFSQGGALSLAASIKSPVQLGGCVALSAWALPKQDLQAHVGASPTAQASPFLVCHGEADGVVTFPNGQAVAAMLQAGGADVTLKTYPGMAHSSCPQEERDIVEFLRKALPNA